jgi:hypothetical protein
VAGIAIIGAVAWLLLRRRRNRNASPEPFPGSEYAYSDGHYAPEVVNASPTETPGASPLGFKKAMAELTTQPSHAELTTQQSHAELGVNMNDPPIAPPHYYAAPVEMDATPTRY